MSDCAEYAAAYRAAMLDLTAPTIPFLVTGGYTFKSGRLLPKGNKPFQPNTRLIAETIAQLKPRSIAEFGCGCGVNLHNLSLLLPYADLYGFDWCQDQIDTCHEIFPKLKAMLELWDITRTFDAPRVDVAFCHITLMHLGGQANILATLRTMIESAQRQVVLLENWGSSDFFSDIRSLFDGLYFYTRPSPELKRKHIMIVSKIPLTYEPLVNYEAELAAPVRENWMNDHLALDNKDWMDE